MSGLKSMYLGLAVLAVTSLSACVELTEMGGGTSSGARSSAPVTLLHGAMIVQPPAGYCVDPKASHSERDTAVILMGKCTSASEASPALITVTIGGEGSSSVLRTGAKALSDYFRSAAGRAALARNGRADAVRVSRVSIADGALVMRVEDRSIGAYWRAVLGLRGRLVTLSVSAPEGQTLAEETGRSILDRSIAAMRRANPAAAKATGAKATAAAGAVIAP